MVLSQKSDKNKDYLVTAEGYSKLKDQIEKLRRDIREIGIKKGEAAGSGSAQWHDNPAYEELEQQENGLIRRLADLKDKLVKARIIDVKQEKDKIEIGSVITVLFIATGEKETYTITDSEMADPDSGRISYQSPLGSILIGKKTGEVVEFRGNRIEILKIE